MEDLFKKFLYTGVGLVTSTVEKVQKSVNDLVEEGKITESEGKKVVNDLVSDIDTKKNEYEEKLRGMVEDIMSKFDFPTSKEVKDLRGRIAELESELAEVNANKPTTKAKKKA